MLHKIGVVNVEQQHGLLQHWIKRIQAISFDQTIDDGWRFDPTEFNGMAELFHLLSQAGSTFINASTSVVGVLQALIGRSPNSNERLGHSISPPFRVLSFILIVRANTDQWCPKLESDLISVARKSLITIKAKALKYKLMFRDAIHLRHQCLEMNAIIILIRYRQNSGSWDLFDWCYNFLTNGEKVYVGNLLQDLAEQNANNKTSKQLDTNSN